MDDDRSYANDDTLPFIVRVDADDEETMGLFKGSGGAETGVRDIAVGALRKNLTRTGTLLREALNDLTEQVGPLRLKEVQVGLEISASGGVQLVGTAGLKAAVTLIFREGAESAD